MNKVKTIEEVVDHIKDGMTVMIAGFMGVGTPHSIIDKMIGTVIQDLTIICTDTARPDVGVGGLISNKIAKKVIY